MQYELIQWPEALEDMQTRPGAVYEGPNGLQYTWVDGALFCKNPFTQEWFVDELPTKGFWNWVS